MKTKDQLTDEILNILDRFDFQKCHAFMVFRDWKVNGKVPTQKNLKEWSKSMLRTLMGKYLSDGDLHMISNHDKGLGAFINQDGDIKLFFFIEQKTSYTL